MDDFCETDYKLYNNIINIIVPPDAKYFATEA